jgi:hypothetical protein
METSIANQNFSSDDPLWYLLAEFSLSEFLSDDDRRDDRMVGLLFQAVQELGMPSQFMENIVDMLVGLAKETWVHAKQWKLESPEQIRIFCQKKILDNAKPRKTLNPYPIEHREKQKEIIPDSEANTIGGWGYFMIERGKDLLPNSSAVPRNRMDLYLYKEGE